MRVLLVEDDVLTGMDLAQQIRDWGYDCDGPHMSSDKALGAIDRRAPDIAIMDFNLAGNDTSVPVAERLTQDGTAIVWLTGYAAEDLPGELKPDPAYVVEKPIVGDRLRQILDRHRLKAR